MVTNKLFVGGFPYETTQEELSALFRTCGTVKSVKILMNRETGQSRGISFIEMSTEAEAQAAIMKLNGTNMGSRKVFVTEARPPEKRVDGPGGKPGFSDRRPGSDRRPAHGAPGGGHDAPPTDEPGREGAFKHKKKWSGKKKWDHKKPGGGKPWDAMNKGGFKKKKDLRSNDW